MHTGGPFHGKQNSWSVKLPIHLHIVPRLKCVVLCHSSFAVLDGMVVKKTDSIVDLATSYGPDGLGFESCKEKRFFLF